jgi:hypothetical protein
MIANLIGIVATAPQPTLPVTEVAGVGVGLAYMPADGFTGFTGESV